MSTAFDDTHATTTPPDPARPSLRDRRIARTRRQIIDTANRLFRQQGFDATTVEEIAAEVDISARTVYRYFPTKDAIVFADLGERLERVPSLLAQRPADEPPVVSLFAALCQTAVDGSSSFELFRKLLTERPTLEHYPHKAVAETVSLDARTILAARTGVDPDDLHLQVVTSTMASWCGLALHLHFEAQAHRPFAEIFLEVATIGFAGLGSAADLAACRTIAADHLAPPAPDPHR